ncbi:MAG: alpha-2-macroglobulin family protein, partial [Leeuwenhoekiella sp.]
FTITAEEDDADEPSVFWDKIEDNDSCLYSTIGFRVEEYKRPTFEVVFDEIKKAYNPGDSVKISGNANSFLGAKLAQTSVSYEIYRSSYYNTWWRSSNSDRTQIAHDTTTTDDEGNFEIPFMATIDKSITNTYNLIYEYSITATVTDLNGETREASTSLKMGKQNLIATLNLPKNTEKGDSITLKINAKNLNGNPVKSKGSLRIYKLKAPDRILNERAWATPEIQQISEEEFIKLYPHEPYKDENVKENWEKSALVYTSSFETDGTFSKQILTDKSWQSGVYSVEVELKSDSLNSTVKQQLTITDATDNYLPDNERFSYRITNTDFRKDGFAEVIIQTAYQDLNLNISAFDGDERIFFKQVTVEGKRVVQIPLPASVSDQIQIHLFGVKNGQSISKTEQISLKKKEKILAFETKTFRDKLQPGLEEQWSFSLKTEENEIPDVEILASMYDASLDQFTQHSWESEPNFYSNVSFPNFESYALGEVENLNTTFYNYLQLPGFFTAFDKLDFFGFTFGQINSYQYRDYLSRKKQQRLKSKDLTGNTLGKVTDENGNALPGVQVLIKNTTKSTTTNFDGEFGIDTKEGDHLVLSYIGYEEYEIAVTKDQNLAIMMKGSSESLDEVVTVGYGAVQEEAAMGAPAAPALNSSMLSGKAPGITIRGMSSTATENSPLYIIDGEIYQNLEALTLLPEEISSMTVLKNAEATALYGAQGANGAVIITTTKGLQEITQVKARKNLDETAFFLPQLKTDEDGVISFNFTSPEALTRWKFSMLAHDKNYVKGTYTAQVVTQKDLSIVPNAPRFLREGDTINFQAKVANLTDEAMTGVALLQLFDATTMQPIDRLLHLGNTSQNFAIKPKNSDVVSWQLVIPKDIPAVTYRVLAKAADFSDGEENIL